MSDDRQSRKSLQLPRSKITHSSWTPVTEERLTLHNVPIWLPKGAVCDAADCQEPGTELKAGNASVCYADGDPEIFGGPSQRMFIHNSDVSNAFRQTRSRSNSSEGKNSDDRAATAE
jgi:hypothetical protein